MLITCSLYLAACAAALVFPPELVSFEPSPKNPVFTAGPAGAWDAHIRERGWILHEDTGYCLWYTGYDSPNGGRKLGYATSPDGYTWTRHPGNPIVGDAWVEDVTVVKADATYYLFAEGEHDRAHLLTSTDRVHWSHQGTLDIRKADGTPLDPGPFGTPSVLYDGGTWYLFYERDDLGIWLAKGTDPRQFTNVQDAPVLARGPEPYDTTMIAANQVVKYRGQYYLYYHATCPANGRDQWTMNVAASTDLVHWEKYPGNPIIAPNHSSGFLVQEGESFRMYCAHPEIAVFLPKEAKP